MQELIDRLVKETGVTPEQAKQSIETIAAFVKEKFPMLEGAVENMFASKPENNDAPKQASGNVMDKISELIPGQTGEKVEAFAKEAVNKAEEVFDNLKDKLNEVIHSEKK